MDRNDNDLTDLQRQISMLYADMQAMERSTAAASKASLREIFTLEKENIEKRRDIALEAASRVKKAELQAINEEYREALALEEKKTQTRMESIRRIQRAEIAAEREIQDLRLQAEQQLTKLQTQRQLMSGANWKEYAKQLNQTKAMQKQIDSNNKWMEALAEKGIDPDSKQGQRLQRRQEKANSAESTENYAKDLIAKLPMLGVKFGETNKNGFLGWLGSLKDMVTGARTDSEGNRHTIASDAKGVRTANQNRKTAMAELEKAAKASGDEDAYMKQYEDARQNLMKRDKKTGKTQYALVQENVSGLRGQRDDAKSRLKDLNAQRTEINNQLKDANLTDERRAALTEQKKKVNAEIKNAQSDVSKITAAINQALADSGLDQLDDSQKDMLEADEAQQEANNDLKDSLYNSAAQTTAVLANLAESLESLSDTISGYQSKVDTRLYGSTENEQQLTSTGWSYWKQISYDLSTTMMSPLIKEETLMNNVIAAVEKGISKDVTQVAMLETVKDKIATTFDAFDGTMRRLIRIQDTNTTAARLGMEASLNELLNEMYETTEYLSDLATTVKDNLVEAEALMEGEEAVEFEYQVQKWLGSLYSVGMSSSGVSSIATALGQLASGDISGITSGGASNLLIMAANNAGLSISDILAEGLDSSNTNKLLSAMVDYMAELVAESNDSLVVQQQLANVYGLTASDLEAATNLTGTYNGKTGYVSALESYTGTYSQMMSNLVSMANSMYSRTSIGEMLNNVWDNVQYSTASGMTNIFSQLTLKVADILDTFAGGIEIPYITVMGSGVDTKLTVANILKSASVVGGFTSSLVSMISSAISNGGTGFTGEGLLKMVGIDTSGSSASSGASTSSSGTATVYNSSVDDLTDSATATAEDESSSTLVEAQEESTEVTNSTINENIVNIYNLLQSVVDGDSSFSIRGAETLTVKSETSTYNPEKVTSTF